MTPADQKTQETQNALRVLRNIQSLLSDGLFPGKVSSAIPEALGFIQSLISQIPVPVEPPPAAEAPKEISKKSSSKTRGRK